MTLGTVEGWFGTQSKLSAEVLSAMELKTSCRVESWRSRPPDQNFLSVPSSLQPRLQRHAAQLGCTPTARRFGHSSQSVRRCLSMAVSEPATCGLAEDFVDHAVPL